MANTTKDTSAKQMVTSSSNLPEKATTDGGSLVEPDDSSFESKAAKKVQLDIDDAPFLDAEPDSPELTAETAPALDDAPPNEAKKSAFTKRKLIILAVLLLILLGGAGAAYFLLLKPAGPPAQEIITVVVPNHDPLISTPQELVTSLEPFWVPLTEKNGELPFLVCTFSFPTTDAVLHQEIIEKITVLRDAIYYYLYNKDSAFLTDAINTNAIKSDLLATVNNYLVQGKLEQIYFENYLVRK